MLVTDISLCQFYREISKRAKNKNYVWIISLIARHDNLTNDKILFVFSANLISNSNSFFHTPGRERYVGRMCPFAEMLNGEDIRDNCGDLWNLYDNFDKVDWKQKHSLAITKFAKEYGISEKQLPAIFVWNLQTSRYKIMPLKEDEDLYQIIKKVIIKLERLRDEDSEIGKNLVDQQEKIWDDVFDEYHGKMEQKKSNSIPAEHEKIFNYDPAGNRFNIVLAYVTVVDFPAFLRRYMAHIEAQTYPYPLSKVEECAMEEISFTNSILIKSTYYRSGHKCTLYHMCVLIP